MTQAQGYEGSSDLRRFLGWAAFVAFIIFVVLFTVAAILQSGLLGAVTAAWLLVFVAFLWTWAYLENNHIQVQAVGSNADLIASEPLTSSAELQLPAKSSGEDLARRHVRAISVIGLLIFGGVALALVGVVGPVSQSFGQDLFVVGLFAIAIGTFWAAFFRWFYQRPLDAATMMAGRPGTMAWSQYVTTGLQAFMKKNRSDIRSVLHNGYVLITPDGLEFWQREKKSLVRIFAIPRASVGGVTAGVVMDQLQEQQCVYLSIPVASGPDESVPILIKGIFGGLKSVSKAPSVFIQTWNAGGTRATSKT